MAKGKGGGGPTIKIGTTNPQVSRAPATPESGVTKTEETTPTPIIKPDPEQTNKEQKKKIPKASVATEGVSRRPAKNSKAKTGVVPMPTSWAEVGVADRMLVTLRDNGDDWAKIRKQWKEMTGLDTAASTLPTRYSRLKASMMTLEDGDVSCSPPPPAHISRLEKRDISFIPLSPKSFPKSSTPISPACCVE